MCYEELKTKGVGSEAKGSACKVVLYASLIPTGVNLLVVDRRISTISLIISELIGSSHLLQQ